ncbi:MAG: sugar ABC transporter permease [Cellulomonadaceae bacterium]|jgi:ABC-type sugar transport system permease subunit|nr:sugar ABC transporter permease [Cellulomonadaceae bacterium]
MSTTSATVVDPRTEGSVRGSTPVTRKKRSTGLASPLEVLGFTGPAILVYVAFVFLPIGFAFAMSFFDGIQVAPFREFIGFDNFARIFTFERQFGQPFFWDALRNNILIAVFSLLLQGPLAIGVALLLNRKMRFRQFFRLLIFVPYVLSEVITGLIFSIALTSGGAVDTWLGRLGLDSLQGTLWLGTTGTGGPGSITFWTVFVVLTWKYVGLAIILFMAGLASVPEELSEAAMIDGASWWQTQWRVTIPLLGPTIRIWAFLSLIGSFQLFDMVWILFGGAPGRLTTVGMHTMATYMVTQGSAGRVGYGAAIGIVLFIFTMIIALLYQKFILNRDLEG